MKNGFTLIEILIVSVITIVLLSIMSGVGYVSQLQRVGDVTRKRNLSEIRDSLEVFHREKGRYPTAAEIGTPIPGASNAAIVCGTTAAMDRYIRNLPCDPDQANGKNYVYYVYNTNQDFALFTTIFNKDDIAVNQSVCKNGCSYLLDDGTLSDAFYNYSIFSSLDYMKSTEICSLSEGSYCNQGTCSDCPAEGCAPTDQHYCFTTFCHDSQSAGSFPKNCE